MLDLSRGGNMVMGKDHQQGVYQYEEVNADISDPSPDAPASGERADWDYTRLAKVRGENDGVFGDPDERSKYGYYMGRPIIGRDSRISGGVYTTGRGEGLVVDEKYGRLLGCYKDIRDEMQRRIKRGEDSKTFILDQVYKYVEKLLPYDMEEVKEILKDLGADIEPVKVALDVFIKERVGVCRHQAILIGYLLEKLVADGVLSGNVSVDRNMNSEFGHAWVRYTNSRGKVIILDTAQHFIGYLDQAPTDRKKGIDRWYYERPEDNR